MYKKEKKKLIILKIQALFLKNNGKGTEMSRQKITDP